MREREGGREGEGGEREKGCDGWDEEGETLVTCIDGL
jgi:hypothetical protein